MRKAILILSLLLAVSICKAQFNVTSFTIPYLYEGENYSTDVQVVSINLSYGNYSLVTISSTPTFLLNMSGNVSFIEDQGQITRILNDYYAVSTYPTKAELDYLNSSFNAFVSSRGSKELDCRVETGLSNPDGSHYLTCTAANECESCRSIPICKAVMYGTLTSPDLMSSPLVQAIMQMEKDFNVMDTNTTKFKTSLANMNSSVSASLNAMKDSLNSILSAVSDLSSPTVALIYQEFNQNPNALGFCYNFYASYNTTALTNTANEVNALAARVPTQSSVGDEVVSIANQTVERQLNRTIREQRDAFNAKYAVWLAEDNNLTENADYLLSRVRDNETTAKLAELEGMLANISILGDARNYDQADILAQNFSQALSLADSYVKGLLVSYNEMIAENSSASDALFEAGLYVASDDIVTNDKLDGLYTAHASIDFMIYNDSPMPISEVNNLTNQLMDIRLGATSIKDEQVSVSTQRVNNIVVAIAKPVVSLSLGIISSLTPLSSADKQKDAPTIIGALLVVADIVVFLVVLGAFLLLVHSRKIELHKLAKVLWVFIFAFFLLLLALGSLTIYNVADMQSRPTTFGPFISEFSGSSKAAVVADLTGANASVRESMTNCSAQIASKMISINKSVMSYKFDNESCITANNTLAESSCLDSIDTTPVVILQSGAYTTIFNVFYTKRAVFQGDENFFNECPIPKVLG